MPDGVLPECAVVCARGTVAKDEARDTVAGVQIAAFEVGAESVDSSGEFIADRGAGAGTCGVLFAGVRVVRRGMRCRRVGRGRG